MTNPTVTPPGSEFEQFLKDFEYKNTPVVGNPGYFMPQMLDDIRRAHHREIVRVLEGLKGKVQDLNMYDQQAVNPCWGLEEADIDALIATYK